MTVEPVTLAELLDAREALITTMIGEMPDAHREFLLGFKRGAADWSLLGIPAAAERWKQVNLARLSAEGRALRLERLVEALAARA